MNAAVLESAGTLSDGAINAAGFAVLLGGVVLTAIWLHYLYR